MMKNLKKYLSIRNVVIALTALILLIVGLEVQDSMRKSAKFRTMQDPIVTEENVNLTGLKELPFSGGAIPIFSELIEKFPPGKTIYVVDGMLDKKGYIDGFPASSLGYGEFPSFKDILFRLFYTKTFREHPELTISEKEEAKKFNVEYKALRIGSKMTSSNSSVDNFVEFIDTLPKDAVAYFHCHHGKGRTSMMLVMADILKNAPQVSLKDIIKRQYLLGSVDLFDTTPWTKGTYGQAMLLSRKHFIQKFYEFVCQRKNGGFSRWSEWNQNQDFRRVPTENS